MHFLRRHLLPILVAAAAVAPATASAADCPGANDRPSSGADLRAATVCVMNAERTARGLEPLKAHPQLEVAALAWSTRMVTEGFFAHASADSTLTSRVTAAGYLPAEKWRLGENLAWGDLDHGTPAQIVQDWMNSEGHRANMLDPAFRDVGIGIVVGRPGAPIGDSATYTADFGVVETKAMAAAAAAADAAAADGDTAAAPVKPAAATTTAAKKKASQKKASRKHRMTSRSRRGRSAQESRRRALRKALRMTAFAGHQRASAKAAAGLHRR
jgi:uncharacterized protein YkwD